MSSDTDASLLVFSDPHYAGPEEQMRLDYENQAISHPVLRWVAKVYRKHVWLDQPLSHSPLLDYFLKQCPQADWVIANGDYSCDSAFIGVSDPPSLQSAELCLQKSRSAFQDRFLATIGDHELGKSSLFGGQGGLHFSSFEAATERLNLQSFWQQDWYGFRLLGVTSTLLALPVFQAEAKPAEFEDWNRQRRLQVELVREAFATLRANRKIILFCHDPTALPFLLEIPEVKEKILQIEMTLIGHLHSPAVYWLAQRLSGLPVIPFMGITIRRLSSAVRKARLWKPFKVLCCPSLTGIEMFHDGGYYTLHRRVVDGRETIQPRLHSLPRLTHPKHEGFG